MAGEGIFHQQCGVESRAPRFQGVMMENPQNLLFYSCSHLKIVKRNGNLKSKILAAKSKIFAANPKKGNESQMKSALEFRMPINCKLLSFTAPQTASVNLLSQNLARLTEPRFLSPEEWISRKLFVKNFIQESFKFNLNFSSFSLPGS